MIAISEWAHGRMGVSLDMVRRMLMLNERLRMVKRVEESDDERRAVKGMQALCRRILAIRFSMQ